MSNLTIRMDAAEKDRLMAWAAVRGTSATEYIKGLIAADMAASSAEERAAAWFHANRAAIDDEAGYLVANAVPGSGIALNHPWPDAEV